MDSSGEVLRLDLGTPTSAVAAGWSRFTPERYSPDRGFGWAGSQHPTGPFAADFGGFLPDPLTGDFHWGIDDAFRVDVPNGRYEVTAVAGARPLLRYGMSVYAEGGLMASGQDDTYSFQVDVNDGRLDLRFAGAGSVVYLLAGLKVDRVDLANRPLVVSAGEGYGAVEGSPVTLRASATGGSGALSFAWDLDGDGTFDAVGQEVAHTFLDNGSYPAVVRVTDAGGQAALAMTMVEVANAPPTAAIEAPTSAVAGAAVSFRGTATDPSPVDVAAGFRYAWDFGDGSTGDADRPSHAYAAPGTYTVRLTVTDKDGASGSAVATIAVVSAGLTASAGGPYAGSEGSPVTLRGTASGGAIQPLAFAWDLNGDGIYETPGQEVAHAFADNGEYLVRMRVTDGSGQQAFGTTTVSVANVAPTASAGGPYAGMAGMPITFAGTATDPSPVDMAAGFRYAWDFGDGSTSDADRPSHAYAAPGTYTVRLTVTDKDGAAGSASTTAVVSMAHHDPGHDPGHGPGHGDPLRTHHDTIPDFGAHATIVSAGSGRWSSPHTWSGHRVPTAGDVVAIREGHAVTYDRVSDASLKAVSIYAGATLTFRTDIDTRLLVGTILVRPDGALVVGTEANPVRADVRARIVIADRPIDTAFDPSQYGTGLIALGKVAMHGAMKTPTFSRLSVEPKAGHRTLTLAEPVAGWRPGDRLILPDTRQHLHGDFHPWIPMTEALTLAGVSADGRVLTLSAPLAYDHLGARDLDGVLDFLPHVMNLSRNVVIDSEDPGGTRGHVLVTGRGDVDIRHVALRGLGRTTNDPLDSTTFDAQGRAARIGTNQIGRYPLHVHHLIGPRGLPEDVPQFRVEGVAVDGGDADHNFRWGIAVHGSHHGLVRGNVVYNAAGSGIVTEDGTETANVIERNFVVRVAGTGSRPDGRGWREIGFEGSSFWFGGPNNIVRDNVASGFNLYAFTMLTGAGPIPAFKGADPAISGQSIAIGFGTMAIREFARNEAYTGWSGLSLWSVGADYGVVHATSESVIKDFRVWHHRGELVNGYPTSRVTFDGIVARGDISRMGGWREMPYGFTFSDYMTHDFTIRRADIQGLGVAIGLPAKVGDPSDPRSAHGSRFTIEDSYLRNHVNVLGETMWVQGGGRALAPRTTVLRNVTFEPIGLSQFDGADIVLRHRPDFTNTNIVVRDELLVSSHNGTPGDDFRVYYEEQAADSIMPQSGHGVWVGAPEAGLTNRMAWDRYGIAFAGAVLPEGSTARARIVGRVVPIGPR